MVPSPDGNGIIFLAGGLPYDYDFLYPWPALYNYFHHLKMNSNGDFEWILMKQRLRVYFRHMFLMDYIDESKVHCYPETTSSTIISTTYTGPPKIGALFQVLQSISRYIIYNLHACFLSHCQGRPSGYLDSV